MCVLFVCSRCKIGNICAILYLLCHFSPWHWYLDDPLKIALNNCFCFCGCWISTSQPYELKKRKTLKCSKKGKVFVSKVWSLIRFSAWPFPFYVDIVKKNAFCALFLSLCPIGNIYIFVLFLLCNLVSLTTVSWRLLEHVIEWFPKAGNTFHFPKERAKLKKKKSELYNSWNELRLVRPCWHVSSIIEVILAHSLYCGVICILLFSLFYYHWPI